MRVIYLIRPGDKMSNCEQCGREVLFPFGCCYCRKAFCSEHVRPENHQCPKLYQPRTREIPKPRNLVFPILALCIFLILSSAIIAYTSYYYGSTELRDPTYQEALQFIGSDQTDKNLYKKEEYICSNFATDFKNNALKVGYRCGYVLVFGPDWNHALNCFNITDHGLIFVEPQKDEIVTLAIGQPYWDRTKYAIPYDRGTCNDTVTSFLIDW